MTFGRRMRRWWASGLVLAVLFTQLVTAAHACATVLSTAPTAATMPCEHCPHDAPAPDPTQLGLCMQHCQSGSQSVDSGPALAVSAPALPSVFYTLPAPPEPTGPATLSAAPPDALAAASPPHTLLHCCRRD